MFVLEKRGDTKSTSPHVEPQAGNPNLSMYQQTDTYTSLTELSLSQQMRTENSDRFT